MDSRLYETNLLGHEMFKDLKESLQEDTGTKLRNLTVLKDDVFYVWNSIESCIFSVNVRHLDEHSGDTPYQRLHLLSPPAFPVERMMSSNCGSRLCLWGSRGVAIAEIPLRWGKGGLFDAGSRTILCKSYCLDERLLYSLGEVRRVIWHPSSLSHLLVLVSDNTIRLYNIGLKSGPKLVKTFSIGRKPVGSLAWTLAAGLGHAAVDVAPLPDSDTLLVLSGEGEVYMLHCQIDLDGTMSAKMSGPLPMYPPADDNYGSESCAVLAMGGATTPPLIVIATCSAQIYHCLLLPTRSEGETPGDGDGDGEGGGEGHALYVVEAVELSLVPGADDPGLHSAYPVHLYPCTPNTYACMHAGGVHAVTLPILGQLKDYALASEGDAESILSAMCSKGSSARHLVCTSDGAQLTPPAGLAVTPAPLPAILILCTDGVLLSRTVEPYELEEELYRELQLRNPALNQEDIDSILKERQKLSFTAIVQEILAREVSQPILNVRRQEPLDPKEGLELVTQATLKLRGQYMARQQRALEAVARKVGTLTALARQQDDWAVDLQKEVATIRSNTINLKKQLALAHSLQDNIKRRCGAVVAGVRARCGPSAAERALLAELERHRARSATLAARLQQLREHAHWREEELRKWQEEYRRKDTALGRSHSDTISAILQQQTHQLSILIEATKLLKDRLSIV